MDAPEFSSAAAALIAAFQDVDFQQSILRALYLAGFTHLKCLKTAGRIPLLLEPLSIHFTA